MLNRFIIILSAFVLSLFVPFEMVEAQNNVFQKGVTAVKNFFKGNKNEKEKQDIKRQIEDIARCIDPTYRCVITFDFNFVGK